MRYIHKGEEPSYMSEWKELRKSCGQKINYDNFDQKARLNRDLRTEQHGICCYCQHIIDHYLSESGDKATESHNEHLYPEKVKGDSMSAQLQMDYGNIFACCVSKGHSKREKHLRHCGEAKENRIIPELIKQPDCANYFRYSLTGKIEPNPSTVEHETKAKECIDILNLNCSTLIENRKDCIDALFRAYRSKSLQDLEQIREELIASDAYPNYVELRLQFIGHLIERQKKLTSGQ